MANARLELAFTPELPGFYHLINNCPYEYEKGSCGITGLYTMARLEAEIFGRNFSEEDFRQAQKAAIPDFSSGTTHIQRKQLAALLHLAPIFELQFDQNDLIKNRFTPSKSLDEDLNQMILSLKKSHGAFIVHFMCRVPGHVFAISITRNANDEQAMYLHDNLDEQAHDARDMYRYIKYFYARFF